MVLAEPDGTFRPEDADKLLIYSEECDAVFGTRLTRELVWHGANMEGFLRWGNLGGGEDDRDDRPLPNPLPAAPSAAAAAAPFRPSGMTRETFDAIASIYDESLPAHVTAHYLRKAGPYVRENCRPGHGLDVGCGTGARAAALADQGYEMTGVDPSREMLNVLERREATIHAVWLGRAAPVRRRCLRLRDHRRRDAPHRRAHSRRGSVAARARAELGSFWLDSSQPSPRRMRG